MIYEHDNTAGFLKATLELKSKQNARYSLRAFAKKIGLSPGGLSQIMNGKKNLSVERAHAIGLALELDPQETEYFLSLVQLESAKAPALKLQYLEKVKLLNPKLEGSKDLKQTLLTLDHFKLISDWYGLAIIELVTIVEGEWTATSIAKKMGLSKIEVENTLTRLTNLELIEQTADGHFVRIAGAVMIHASVPNEAIRNYYTGVHQRSLESLTTQTVAEKVIGAQVFAFDPAQIDEVRELADQFLNQLNELAKKGKHRTQVYQAITNIFKLTNEEKIK